MTEYLIPTKYSGTGFGISVMFAGLEDNINYDSLEISIDGVNYINVEQNLENKYNSIPISYSDLTDGKLYTVYGRIVKDGTVQIIENNMLAENGDVQDIFDPIAFLQNVSNQQLESTPSAPTVLIG
jgi:hypothetical protein